MATRSQQISAVEIAIRILKGGVKAPKPGSMQANMLAEQLAAALDTIRDEARNLPVAKQRAEGPR